MTQPNILATGQMPAGSDFRIQPTDRSETVGVTVLNGATANLTGSSFVLRPGGTAGGNVYTDWPSLMAVVQTLPGAKDVVIDDSLGACHATAGTWTFDDVRFWVSSLDSGAARTLLLDDGCIILTSVVTFDNLVLQSNSTAAVFVPGNAGEGIGLNVRFMAGIVQSTIFPMFRTGPAGSSISITFFQSTNVNNAGSPCIQADAAVGSVFLRFLDASLLAANALTGAGSITVQWDVSPNISLNQPGLTTLATQFQPVPNFQQATANTGTTTATVSCTSGNLARKRSGLVQVRGVATGIASGAANITVSLLRDGVTSLVALPALGTLGTSAFSIPIQFIDTLPDNVNHTYAVQAVASAGTITTGAGGLQVEAYELGA